jgi:hypothetical protein
VTGFIIGFVVSLVAGVPAFLFALGGRGATFTQRIKLWGIGAFIRFALIGAALYYIFTQTGLPRVPVVIGLGVAWLLSFVAESVILLRS